MAQYIDKDAIAAEIERIMNEQQEICKADVAHGKKYPDGKNVEIIYQFQQLIKFLDTLEVKEVDLEQEIQQHINDCLNIKFPTTDIKMIAKDVEYTARKFFELGLKAKEE